MTTKTPRKIPPPPEELKLDEILPAIGAGRAQLEKVCNRPGNDKVRQVFCGANPPTIASLKSLQQQLGLGIVDPTGTSGEDGNPGFTFNAHSNALSARSVSVINPRVILYSAGQGAIADHVTMGFARGDQFVEIAAADPASGNVAYYLLTYEQPCNSNDSCTNADLLTPTTESGWTGYTLYEDTDLKNTVFDCKVCHQPSGPGTAKMLRMQNLQLPWHHWFLDVSEVDVSPPGGGPNVTDSGRIPGLDGVDFDGNKALIEQFMAAHSNDGEYGGIPVALANQSTPHNLAAFIVGQGFPNMPNETADTANIFGFNFPVIYPGRSVGWQRAYDASISGDFISVPYHGLTVAEPTKLANMTKAYTDVMNGLAARQTLPDIRNVFITGAEADMGFRVKPGLGPEEILAQACKPCHNSKLDQTISRAEFDLDIDNLSKRKIRAAIDRINMKEDDAGLMPPRFYKSLTGTEKQAVVDYLKSKL